MIRITVITAALLALAVDSAGGQQLVDADRSLLQHVVAEYSSREYPYQVRTYPGFLRVPEIPRARGDVEVHKALGDATFQAMNAMGIFGSSLFHVGEHS
jgi:hypothetical protein